MREVAGFAPYERRVMELLKVGKDKRALKVRCHLPVPPGILRGHALQRLTRRVSPLYEHSGLLRGGARARRAVFSSRVTHVSAAAMRHRPCVCSRVRSAGPSLYWAAGPLHTRRTHAIRACRVVYSSLDRGVVCADVQAQARHAHPRQEEARGARGRAAQDAGRLQDDGVAGCKVLRSC